MVCHFLSGEGISYNFYYSLMYYGEKKNTKNTILIHYNFLNNSRTHTKLFKMMARINRIRPDQNAVSTAIYLVGRDYSMIYKSCSKSNDKNAVQKKYLFNLLNQHVLFEVTPISCYTLSPLFLQLLKYNRPSSTNSILALHSFTTTQFVLFSLP